MFKQIGGMNMNEITKVFNFQGNQLRTVVIDNEPWFVAKDLCNILDISNSRMALQRLDETEKGENNFSNWNPRLITLFFWMRSFVGVFVHIHKFKYHITCKARFTIG